MMTNPPTWEVFLPIHGPISVANGHRMNIFKGYRIDGPFYSDINLHKQPYGVKAEITAFAHSRELAFKAGLIFVGQMLDALALQINLPLLLDIKLFSEQSMDQTKRREYQTRRIVEEEEWVLAFNEAHRLKSGKDTPTFLRALSWFRKGLNSEDPFDKFLAFWNSIETTVGKYYDLIEMTPEEKCRAEKGSKNQTWVCFKDLWGEDCNAWTIIGKDKYNDDKPWIDQSHEIRTQIAHGTIPVQIESIENVISRLDQLEQVACLFLKDWRKKWLQPPEVNLLRR